MENYNRPILFCGTSRIPGSSQGWGGGVGIAQTRRENHISFSSPLTNGASKLSYQLKLFLHCKVQLFRSQP